MRTIYFKSTPNNWRKEYLGIKPNTLRSFETILNSIDIRKEILDKYLLCELNLINIVITNTETKETFTREVTDVTFFNEMYIISWKHK